MNLDKENALKALDVYNRLIGRTKGEELTKAEIDFVIEFLGLAAKQLPAVGMSGELTTKVTRGKSKEVKSAETT
jgi:hypothetical protein